MILVPRQSLALIDPKCESWRRTSVAERAVGDFGRSTLRGRLRGWSAHCECGEFLADIHSSVAHLLRLAPIRESFSAPCGLNRRAVGRQPSVPVAGCSLLLDMQLIHCAGRQMKPAKRGAIPKNSPPILDRLNLSAELWLHTIEPFRKRRLANRATPASRFNATARPALQLVAAQ